MAVLRDDGSGSLLCALLAYNPKQASAPTVAVQSQWRLLRDSLICCSLQEFLGMYFPGPPLSCSDSPAEAGQKARSQSWTKGLWEEAVLARVLQQGMWVSLAHAVGTAARAHLEQL